MQLIGQQSRRRGAAMMLGAALLATACSSTATAPPIPSTTIATVTTTTAAPTTSIEVAETSDTADPIPAEFEYRPSARQVTVTGAEPGHELHLMGNDFELTGVVDEQGNLLFRRVPPGRPYQIVDPDASPDQVTGDFEVADFDDVPKQEFYAQQVLEPGLNYLETRDGTLLAAMVRLPDDIANGPFPTVIEYSGYDPANPDRPQPSTEIFRNLGYATVGINMRGSGCSGGAFDYFEELQAHDGYDAVETVAAQPWVHGNHVGMVGISYPGISQLFVAATQPPSLAAISPLSVIEDSYRSVIYPGGIYNNGFAKTWGEERQEATAYAGQEWARKRIDDGDTICEANQLLRSQNVDLAAQAEQGAYYDPQRWDHLAPRTVVDQITVPVFIAGAWQDEQTGGRFATMLDDFTAAPVLKATLYNGAHGDSASPEVLQRWAEFMDVYVAQRTPQINPLVRAGAAGLYLQAFGVEGLDLPPDRFTSLEQARETIESEPPIRVLLEMGGNPAAPGGPLPRLEYLFESWPPPQAQLETWFLNANQRLSTTPTNDGQLRADSFLLDPDQSQRTTPAADDVGDAFDNLAWESLTEGTALAYETGPLPSDIIITGSGVANLWVRSVADDMDIQVTLSEIRPDGQEMYIQSGWLRASHRVLDAARSTATLPFHTHQEIDAEPLPAGEFTEVSVEIFPVTHALRAGSRLRLVIDTPGATRNLWTFDLTVEEPVEQQVGRSAVMPSAISLPVLDNLDVPIGLPPCPGTRSQPCRQYVAIENRAVDNQ